MSLFKKKGQQELVCKLKDNRQIVILTKLGIDFDRFDININPVNKNIIYITFWSSHRHNKIFKYAYNYLFIDGAIDYTMFN